METVTRQQNLDRCTRGIHKWEPVEDSDSMVECKHCHRTDEVPDCMFYVSPEKPECGDPGYTFVTVRGRAVKATVPLCKMHKAVHDEAFASARTTRKAG